MRDAIDESPAAGGGFPRGLVMAALMAALVACDHGPRLTGGAWESAKGDAGRFEFRTDGGATWTLPMDSGPEAFELRYAFDASQEPAHLDLEGFDRGPLKGLALYCILAFEEGGDAFRLDCDPAGPGQGETARPVSFGADTRTYARATDAPAEEGS